MTRPATSRNQSTGRARTASVGLPLRRPLSRLPGLGPAMKSISWTSGVNPERSAVTGEYRIDDLARAAGTTVRNVRAYQERGLLMAPARREGRAAIYNESHLERLKIIDLLLQRGFTTAHIADFITSWETGKDLTEVLGLQHAVTATWTKAAEAIVIPRELASAFLGDGDAELLAKLSGLGIAQLDADNVTITQPKLLETFQALNKYGLGLAELIDLFTSVSGRVKEIADLLVHAARSHITAQHGNGWLPNSDDEVSHLTEMLNTLREVGVSAVHTTLASALDEAVETELADYLVGVADKRGRKPSD
ncbi:MerR family transcriptional regulator [Smaragdicoccus niigatensis]|uniref:MerR family transcriptional regulator n=1 Tax=Smaragdicoccus niigatensis TaxID=359359 RepID=UPI000AD22766|nr:MerR family transcriptional regulator [Smaragdicoccus niigatensis]